MSKDNGGPAFPWCGDLNECPTINLGMSLRDYFAAKAMAAMIHQVKIEWPDDKLIIIAAYRMADGMLAEREK